MRLTRTHKERRKEDMTARKRMYLIFTILLPPISILDIIKGERTLDILSLLYVSVFLVSCGMN
jgi:hypothetical protein